MLSRRKTCVIDRQLFKQFDIGCQAHARMGSFDQVVTEQRIDGKAVADNGMKGPDIIDRLAMKDSVEKEILLGVGNGLAVGVGAGGVGEDARDRKSVV